MPPLGAGAVVTTAGPPSRRSARRYSCDSSLGGIRSTRVSELGKDVMHGSS